MASQIIRTWTAPPEWVALHPFDKPRVGPAVPTLRNAGLGKVVGRVVVGVQRYVGSYGMGGPGFVALGLSPMAGGSAEWLTLTLWAADAWCLYDGAALNVRLGYDFEDWAGEVAGGRLCAARVTDAASRFVIRNRDGPRRHQLEVPKDKSRLPPRAGTGEPPEWFENDSLLDAWVLAPTDDLYV